jgi:FemAB-related protein (PEP-CTERM system-associated)
MEQVHGHECVYLGVRGAEGRLRAVLPLVRVRSPIFGHFLVSMPFVNYGGPLGEEEAVGLLVREAVRIADCGSVDLLELRSSHEAAVGLPASHRKITVLLDLLPGQPDALWRGLSSKVRSQIKRPIKEGAEFRFGPGEIGPFYEVFARHMRDLGTPVQPRGFFERAHDAFSEAMWFGCVYLASRPAAVGCGFRWGDRFELVWASSLREHSATAPNMLLYWRFLERCAADGAAVFDFGRCTPGGGTHRFKAQWGGRDQQLWWYQHGRSAGAGTPSPDSGPYSLGPKIWSHLPLAVANALGPRIVRFIP